MDGAKISLGIHIFMSLLWLVDIGFIMMLVSQWYEVDPLAHFDVSLARAAIGALEL
jgi:hypothetical protein